MTNCTVKDCKNKQRNRGLCPKHHTKAYYDYLDGNNDPRFDNYSGNQTIYSMNGLGSAWSHMFTRCYDTRSTSYKYYGGRGITICDEWLNDPSLLYKHIGPKPGDDHTIDRIDNDGNYEPGNVRWATKREQSNNTRRKNRNNSPGIRNHVTKSGIAYYSAVIYTDHHNIYLGSFDTLAGAINARKNAEIKYP